MLVPAARVSDTHTCPLLEPRPNGDGSTTMLAHVGGPILPPGSADVRIGGQPAATVGTLCRCTGGGNVLLSQPIDTITTGSATVRINGKAAARRGDRTGHGGEIATGAATVLVGS
jgi:uncharacterized Zn-binding protein involved in type VI secretion